MQKISKNKNCFQIMAEIFPHSEKSDVLEKSDDRPRPITCPLDWLMQGMDDETSMKEFTENENEFLSLVRVNII